MRANFARYYAPVANACDPDITGRDNFALGDGKMDALGINWEYLLLQLACLTAPITLLIGAFVMIARFLRRK